MLIKETLQTSVPKDPVCELSATCRSWLKANETENKDIGNCSVWKGFLFSRTKQSILLDFYPIYRFAIVLIETTDNTIFYSMSMLFANVVMKCKLSQQYRRLYHLNLITGLLIFEFLFSKYTYLTPFKYFVAFIFRHLVYARKKKVWFPIYVSMFFSKIL